MDDKDIVSAVRALLADKVGREKFELWFGANTRLLLRGSTLVVEAANQFSQDWLRTHYRREVEAASREALGSETAVEFRVDESLKETSASKHVGRQRGAGKHHRGGHEASFIGADTGTAVLERPATPRTRHTAPRGVISFADASASLRNAESHAVLTSSANAGNTFPSPRRKFATLDGFIVGTTNKLAHASADMVAHRPGCLTPLVVYGPTGTGKTHLLEGIWSAARRNGHAANALYLSAEQFTTQFVEALRGTGLPNFRRKYRGVDVLIIDDLQFLAGKRATLVELLHTIDALLREGRQLVFAADRAPSELGELGPELTTRLAGGMVCKLEVPEHQTRLKLLEQFAAQLEVTLDDETANYVAAHVTASARELRGALNRLHATSQILNTPINKTLAEETLVELIRGGGRTVRLADIEKAVCDVFGLSGESLQSDRRAKTVSTPRMLAMWLARKHTRAGLAEIGEYFGRRSHSTVISAHKRVTDWLARQAPVDVADRRCKLEEAINAVEKQLRAG